MAEQDRTTLAAGCCGSLSLHFVVAQLATIRAGQEAAQATLERQLVQLGQLQELVRQILALALVIQSSRVQSTGQNPNIWTRAHDWSRRVELASKLYRLYLWSRAVFWPAYGYGVLKWLGWL